MNTIGEKLSEALNKKKDDVNNFIWKGKKIKVGDNFVQEEKKLVDANEEELKEWHEYCHTMLNNTSKENPGRYHVLSIIADQRSRCNAELGLRHLESSEDSNIPRYKLNIAIQEWLNNNKGSQTKDFTIGDISNITPEYSDIPLNLIVEGCIDKLGVFNRKFLKLNFILKQGLWLNQAETQDLTEYDEITGEVKNRLDVVKDRLGINKNIKLAFNPRGLSYSQLRAMLQLKNKKYSEMTTEQLKTLRNRILFNLENEVRLHISQWEKRMEQIEQVAQLKGIKL